MFIRYRVAIKCLFNASFLFCYEYFVVSFFILLWVFAFVVNFFFCFVFLFLLWHFVFVMSFLFCCEFLILLRVFAFAVSFLFYVSFKFCFVASSLCCRNFIYCCWFPNLICFELFVCCEILLFLRVFNFILLQVFYFAIFIIVSHHNKQSYKRETRVLFVKYQSRDYAFKFYFWQGNEQKLAVH